MKDPKEYRFYAVVWAMCSAACLAFGLSWSTSIILDFMILIESVHQGIELTDDSSKLQIWMVIFSFVASIGMYGGYINCKLKHQEAVAQKSRSPESGTKS